VAVRAACLAFAAGAWWVQQQPALWPTSATLATGLVAALVVVLLERGRRVLSVRGRSDAFGADGRSRVIDARCASDRAPRADAPAAQADLPTRDRPARKSRFRYARAQCALFMASLVALALLGASWAAWRSERVLADTLPHALELRDLVVIGTIAALPARDANGTHFPFDVESVVSRDDAGHALQVPSHLALGWYPAAPGGAVPNLQPGQRWRLTVRLKRPHGSANPDGFDYEFWLLEAGLRATGYVRPGADPVDDVTNADDASEDRARDDAHAAVTTRKLDDFVWSPSNAVERARAFLRDRMLRMLADGHPLATAAPYAGVLVALVVGDQRSIPQSDWTVFNRTGIGHLVSISGLHVSMLAALGARLVFVVWCRRPRWCVRLAAHRAAAVAGAAVALGYCLLAGFGVPAQRTLYMIAVVALALWTNRFTSPSRTLAIALFVVVLLDPWSVTGSGTWLSFAAVASIFYVTAGRLEAHPISRMRKLRASFALALRIQWAVTLALTPLTILFFDQVSIVSPLANAIAIPLVSFVVTPLALAGAIAPSLIGALLLRAAHGLVVLLAAWLEALSGTSVAVWSGPVPPAWAFSAAMIGVVWWLAPRGLAHRWAGALWMVPLFALPPDRPAAGTVRLIALDIGQGTSVLVETAHTNVLFDTGPQYGPPRATGPADGNDAGNRVIVPFLRARGIDHLDAMIVSHNDSDHSGGALSILAAIPVGIVRSSLLPESPIVRASLRHVPCLPGQTWSADGVTFTLLAPSPEVYTPQPNATGKAVVKPNAKSCVLRVEAADRVALLTADIERPQEAALIERAPDAIRADAMLVPHHGSRTSSSDAFLDAVHPTLAIVQAGYLNRFGHPRPDVLARYDARGIEILRNDRDGAITLTMDANGVAADRYRISHARYWYDR
jgi:competence protein ComEC